MNLHLIKEIKRFVEGKKSITIKDIQEGLPVKFTVHEIFTAIEILLYYGDLVQNNGIYENPFIISNYSLCIVMDNCEEIFFKNLPLDEVNNFIKWYDSKNRTDHYTTMSLKNVCLPKHKICLYKIFYKDKEVSINNVLELIERENIEDGK